MKRWKETDHWSTINADMFKQRSIDLKMDRQWNIIDNALNMRTMIVKRALQKLIRIHRKLRKYHYRHQMTLYDLQIDLKLIPTGRNPPLIKAIHDKLFNYPPF